jgi:hypothetical protein
MFKIKNVYMNPKGMYTMTEGTANLYRIYKNPSAKDLFIRAQKASTVEERKRLFDEMGEYEIVNETPKPRHKNRFIQFLKGIFNAG